ncbi:GCN5-like N-acetyltransferase [Pontibacter sp. BAB1700]|nr:GNAT family N-acetyltransferase [Pontibacter sp. BAB1700]EJF10155.1 GCN5-like N-acetyltransferase [Pontibacter sp. BAB1700]
MINFKLRPWTMEDLDSLVKYADNFNIARNMADIFPHPYTREKGQAFLEMATKGNPPHILAIEVEGEAAGGIGIHPQQDIYRKNAEMGYWLAESHWGKGIVTKLYARWWTMALPIGTSTAFSPALSGITSPRSGHSRKLVLCWRRSWRRLSTRMGSIRMS